MSNRRKFIQQLAWGSAGFIASQYPGSVYAKDDLVRISILHTNDIHCHIEPFPESDSRNKGQGGMTRLSGIVEQLRAKNPNTFLFDAGDMFQGTPYFNYYKGELVLKIMSKMGYNAGTIGNHEFDNGLEGIKEALPFANFPIISSNYDFSDTILRNSFLTHKTFLKEGIKIGLYGARHRTRRAGYEKEFSGNPLPRPGKNCKKNGAIPERRGKNATWLFACRTWVWSTRRKKFRIKLLPAKPATPI